MVQDTVKYDSLNDRPLPKWLTDQKQGLNTIQPAKIIIKEDKSLEISFTITAVLIVLVIVLLTTIIIKKKTNNIK